MVTAMYLIWHVRPESLHLFE